MLEDSISWADYPCIKLTGYWHAHTAHTHTHTPTHTRTFMLTISLSNRKKMAEKHLQFLQKGDEKSNERVKQEVENIKKS